MNFVLFFILGSSESYFMTRRHLFEIAIESGGINFEQMLNHMESYLLNFGPFPDINLFKRELRRFKSELKTRWTKAGRRKTLFEEQNN